MLKPFGKTRDGHEAQLYTLENTRGLRADFTDYGATLVNLWVPDRHGQPGDVVLGFHSVDRYEADSPYFGATIGRCGNRIAHGRFTLDGRTHQLATNNAPGGIPCHLHGGPKGFDRVFWRAESAPDNSGAALRFRYRSPDGEEGYPGNLEAAVTFTLTADNALRIDYEARTDAPTLANLTNHSYFNLGGEGVADILGHILSLHAPAYTPVNAGLIPTGEIVSVEGTPFDFLAPHTIGERIETANEQLRFAGGYDHNFVLARPPSDRKLMLAATVLEPQSGRLLEVHTTEPGLQFYSGNFLAGAFAGKNGHVYPKRGGFCLESQHFPDAPNQPKFPPVILRPGETLRSTTEYRFRIR
jgi:aldose 1-epimerase